MPHGAVTNRKVIQQVMVPKQTLTFKYSNQSFDRAAPDCLDLISNIIQYNPTARLTPMQCCAHHYYDELRDPSTV